MVKTYIGLTMGWALLILHLTQLNLWQSHEVGTIIIPIDFL